MNEHIEFLVKVKQRTLLVVVKIVLWILTVLGVLLTFTGILSIFPLIFAVITGLCANLCGLRADIEYEYTLTDKEMDIDVIYAKQSRKHLITLDLEKLEIMAPVGSARLQGYKNRGAKFKDFSSMMTNPVNPVYDMYYDGNKCFRIEPDERLFKAIKDVAPFKVYTD